MAEKILPRDHELHNKGNSQHDSPSSQSFLQFFRLQQRDFSEMRTVEKFLKRSQLAYPAAPHPSEEIGENNDYSQKDEALPVHVSTQQKQKKCQLYTPLSHAPCHRKKVSRKFCNNL